LIKDYPLIIECYVFIIIIILVVIIIVSNVLRNWF